MDLESLGKAILAKRQEIKGLQAQEKMLVKEWKEALGQYRIEGGGLRLTATRKVIYRPSAVEFLAKRELYDALRPVTEGLERYYEERRVSMEDLHPHIDRVEVGYRVDPVKKGVVSEPA